MSDGPKTPEASRRIDALRRRQRTADADPQPGARRARQVDRQAQRLRPPRQGRRHHLAVRHRDGRADRQLAGPQRHRQQLQRRPDAVGHLADLRGVDGRQAQGLREGARLRLRDPERRDRPDRAAADQGDGAVPARGLRGRPEDRDRLHDRGQRAGRLLPLPPRPPRPAPPRRQAADALRQGPLPATTRSPARRSARSCAASGSRSSDPDPEDAERHADARLPAGARQGRGPVHGPRGRQLGAGQRLVHGQRGRRHLSPARSGATRRRRTSSTARSSSCTSRPNRSVLDEPDAIVVSPRGGVVLCEDGDGEDHGGHQLPPGPDAEREDGDVRARTRRRSTCHR